MNTLEFETMLVQNVKISYMAEVGKRYVLHYLDESEVSVDDFEVLPLRPLWALLEEKIRFGHPIDRNVFERVLKGNETALKAFLVNINSYTDVDLLARLKDFRRRGLKRRLATQLQATLSELEQDKVDFSRVSRDLVSASEALSSVGSQVRNCESDGERHIALHESAYEQRTRVLTGFPALDAVTSGLLPNLIAVGARSGVGKSMLAAGLVRNWMQAGVRSGVLCLEDDSMDLQNRLKALDCGLNLHQASGNAPITDETQQEKLGDWVSWLQAKGKFLDVLDPKKTATMNLILPAMRKMVMSGCRAIILDNLTAVAMDGSEDDRLDQKVHSALLELRNFAVANRVPVVVIGHLKRTGGSEEDSTIPPRSTDFANSSSWERLCRLQVGLWGDPGGAWKKMRILKQTQGEAGIDFELQYRAQAGVITGVTRCEREVLMGVKPSGKRSYSRNIDHT